LISGRIYFALAGGVKDTICQCYFFITLVYYKAIKQLWSTNYIIIYIIKLDGIETGMVLDIILIFIGGFLVLFHC